MKKGFSLTIILFLLATTFQSQIVSNGDFSSGTAGWGCSPEINPESAYGGSSTNNVVEIDATANTCQTISGLVVGNVYSLSYQCSRRTGSSPSPNPTIIDVTVSNGALFEKDTRSNGTFSLTPSTYNFTAQTSSHDITFIADVDFGGSTSGMIVDNIEVTLLSALPVELLFFKITSLDNQSVLINWETATEINNDFFTIEKSKNGIEWETAETINGSGSSTQNLKYIYIDQSPYGGISYYRLKQTDYNKSFKYSEIQYIDINKPQEVFIYPNPSKSHALKIGSIDIFPFNIMLCDKLGQLVFSSPNHTSKDLNLEGIDAGDYYLFFYKNDKIIYKNHIILE